MIGRQINRLATDHHHLTVHQLPLLISDLGRIGNVSNLQDVDNVLKSHICTGQSVQHLAGQMALRQIDSDRLSIGVKADILQLGAGQQILLATQVNGRTAHANHGAVHQLVFLVGNVAGVHVLDLQHIDHGLRSVSGGGKSIHDLACQVIHRHVGSHRIAANVIANILTLNARRQRSRNGILGNRLAVSIKADDLTGGTDQYVLLVLQRGKYTAGLDCIFTVLRRLFIHHTVDRQVNPFNFAVNIGFLAQHLTRSAANRNAEDFHDPGLDGFHHGYDGRQNL